MERHSELVYPRLGRRNEFARAQPLHDRSSRARLGLGVLMAVLFASGPALQRGVPHAQDAPRDWALFGGALAGWLITVTVGLVNTTLHDEHGLFSVLLFGLWLGHRAVRTQSDRGSPRP